MPEALSNITKMLGSSGSGGLGGLGLALALLLFSLFGGVSFHLGNP